MILIYILLAILMFAGFILAAIYQIPLVSVFFAIGFIACVVSLAKGKA